MTKIAINLLPIEFREQALKNAKFYKIQTIGIVTILLMILLSSITVALRILQSQNISQIQNKLTQSEQKITDLKNIQASLFLLKNRLNTIDQFLGIPSKPSEIYELITKLTPATVSISSVSVSSTGEVLVLAAAPDGMSVDSLITNLTSSENNEDKISQVSLESINRSKDGIYRISLKIKPK